MQSWLEGRNWLGKCAQATGMTASLRILSSKADIFRKRATKPFQKQKHRQKHLGLRRKRTVLLLCAPKSSFQMKVNFAFNLEIKVSESGGRVERHRIHVAWSVKFPQSVMVWAAMSSAGVGPLCFLKSTVNAAIYQNILEHFMLPSADKLYGDADFISQQDLAPAHTDKGTKSWFNDHGVTGLNWPANSPDSPVLSRGRWATPDPTMQMTRRPLSKQPGLPLH